MALTEAILSIKSIVPEDLLTDVTPKPDRYLLIKKFITFLQYAVEDATNKVTLKETSKNNKMFNISYSCFRTQ